MWWGPGVLSLGPPKGFLPKLGRKLRERVWFVRWTKIPPIVFLDIGLFLGGQSLVLFLFSFAFLGTLPFPLFFFWFSGACATLAFCLFVFFLWHWLFFLGHFFSFDFVERGVTVISFVFVFFFRGGNYSKPTWGMTRFHFAYPWFKTLHFADLNFNSLSICYPPLAFSLENNFCNQNIT